jgi:hypothetical protein
MDEEELLVEGISTSVITEQYKDRELQPLRF